MAIGTRSEHVLTRTRPELQQAAESKGVEQLFIDEVNTWNGKDDLEADDDEESTESTDGDAKGDGRMEVDTVPVPPSRVTEVYQNATPLLRKLLEDPANPELLGQLGHLNEVIREGNKAQNVTSENESDHISTEQWLIPVSFFKPHFEGVLGEYRILQHSPENEKSRHRLSVEKRLIDDFIEKNHFPEEWSVLSADDYLEQKSNEDAAASPPVIQEPTEGVEQPAGGSADEAATGAPRPSAKRIQYPWPTGKAADGSLIVGVRRHGRWGTQVCIEGVETDGRVVRRLEAASAVGLLEVEKYKAIEGHKILSEGQSAWSSADRHDFVELLWVTKSQIQQKNIAAGKKDPPAECCAKFKSKGIRTLTVSSLGKVLGAASARAQIETVCERDDIPPPWDAGWVSYYDNPAKVEKNATRRRALQDAQSSTSSAKPRRRRASDYSSSGEDGDARDARVDALESMVKELAETVNGMAAMFKTFMKASAAQPPSN